MPSSVDGAAGPRVLHPELYAPVSHSMVAAAPHPDSDNLMKYHCWVILSFAISGDFSAFSVLPPVGVLPPFLSEALDYLLLICPLGRGDSPPTLDSSNEGS